MEKEKFNIAFENLGEDDMPVTITQPEFMRRMKDMSAMGGGMGYMGNLPETYNLVVNSNPPVIAKLVNESDESKKEKTINQLTDLAMLSKNMLKGEKLTSFIKRSVDLF